METMTAEQRVLAKHPSARERTGGSVYKFYQYSLNGKTCSGITELGKSWEDAASKLPTVLAGGEDEHSCDEVLIAKYLQDPEFAARFQAECAKLEAEDAVVAAPEPAKAHQHHSTYIRDGYVFCQICDQRPNKCRCKSAGAQSSPPQESAEEAWERGFRTAQRMAASLDPWKEHLARNPIAATLSSPGQCVEVKNKLILAQSVYPYTPPKRN